MKNPLSKYASNEHSQFGEDGITQRIFDVLPKQNDYWSVEFGAWDGKYLSNTHYFVSELGWNGIFIEGNPKKFPDLEGTYCGFKNALLINKLVNFEGENSLDLILSGTPIPKEFDVLSIDIDGNDYHVWESVKKYSPKLVIIEFNPTIPSDVEFIQDRNFSLNQGNSLRSLTKLAKAKGYELIATTQCNGFFIRSEYFSLFNIESNRVEDMWTTELPAPRVFQLFDGTLVLSNSFKLIWASRYVDRFVDKYDLQKLPRSQRYFSDSPNNFWVGLMLRVRALLGVKR